MVLDPNYASNQRVYVLYAHDAPIGGTAPCWGTLASAGLRRLPDPARRDRRRLRDQRPALADRPRRGTARPIEAGADRGLVPAVSEPLGRQPGVRRLPGTSTRSGGDGASFNFVDFGQDGNPDNPCGDPPGGVGGTHEPADGAGRRAAQPGPAHRRPTRSRSTAAVIRIDPDDGRRAAQQPERFGSSEPERATDHRLRACATRSGSRSRPTTSSGSGTSAGPSGRSSTGCPTDPRSVVNFGWPCYEGAGRQDGYDVGQPEHLREPLRLGRDRRHGDRPDASPTTTTSRWSPARAARPAARRWPGSTSTAPARIPADYDDALFFADYSRDCIWVVAGGAGGAPDPADGEHLRRRRDQPDLRRGRARRRRSTTPNFDAGQVKRIELQRAQTADDLRRSPTSGLGAADGQLQRLERLDPGDIARLRLGPRRRRPVRRLDRGLASAAPTPSPAR